MQRFGPKNWSEMAELLQSNQTHDVAQNQMEMLIVEIKQGVCRIWNSPISWMFLLRTCIYRGIPSATTLPECIQQWDWSGKIGGLDVSSAKEKKCASWVPSCLYRIFFVWVFSLGVQGLIVKFPCKITEFLQLCATLDCGKGSQIQRCCLCWFRTTIVDWGSNYVTNLELIVMSRCMYKEISTVYIPVCNVLFTPWINHVQGRVSENDKQLEMHHCHCF